MGLETGDWGMGRAITGVVTFEEDVDSRGKVGLAPSPVRSGKGAATYMLMLGNRSG